MTTGGQSFVVGVHRGYGGGIELVVTLVQAGCVPGAAGLFCCGCQTGGIAVVAGYPAGATGVFAGSRHLWTRGRVLKDKSQKHFF